MSSTPAAAGAAEEVSPGNKRRRRPLDVAKMPLRGVLHACPTGRPMKSKDTDRSKRRPEAEKSTDAREGTEGGKDNAAANDGGGASAPSGVIAPKVQLIGGRLVVDASSLVVTPVVAPSAADFDTVHESHSHVTSSSYGRRQHSERWTAQDTELFFDALRCYGTDFSLFERLFPGRTRRQLKNKFKREEKESSARVEEALSASTRRMDLSQYEALSARAAARAEKEKEKDKDKENDNDKDEDDAEKSKEKEKDTQKEKDKETSKEKSSNGKDSSSKGKKISYSADKEANEDMDDGDDNDDENDD